MTVPFTKMLIVLFLSVATARPLNTLHFPNTTITPLLPPLFNTTSTHFNITNTTTTTTTTNPYNIYTVPNSPPLTTTITTRVTSTTTLPIENLPAVTLPTTKTMTGTTPTMTMDSDPAQSDWTIDAKTLVIIIISFVAFISLLYIIYWCMLRKRGDSNVPGQKKKRSRVGCFASVRMQNLNQV